MTTRSEVLNQIRNIYFINGDRWQLALGHEPDEALQRLTICLLVSSGGFVVTGFSACENPGDYDVAVGQDLAFDDAVDKLGRHVVYCNMRALAPIEPVEIDTDAGC